MCATTVYATTWSVTPWPLSNLINGSVLPMTPTMSDKSSAVVLDITDGKWQRITNKTVRLAGTRAPIHAHPHGGETCVMQGEMTLYMDDAPIPVTKQAGECYWMPPGHRMSGVNTGKGTAIMFDSFLVPLGTPTIIFVEPGFEQYNK